MLRADGNVLRLELNLVATPAGDLHCEICGGQMIQRQCKIICPNCGFTRDCSDP